MLFLHKKNSTKNLVFGAVIRDFITH